VVPEEELAIRSLTRIRVRERLRLVAMHGSALRGLGADASVVQGPYEVTWLWSAAFHAHPDGPDGICYRARHDDSGFAIPIFERVEPKAELLDSTGLLEPAHAREVARWLERYGVGVASSQGEAPIRSRGAGGGRTPTPCRPIHAPNDASGCGGD
jgi:hypothetical protein